VILLHVVNPVYTIPPTGISAPALVPVPQWVFTEKTKEVERFAALELRGLPVRRLLYEGDPESQIAAFAKEEDVQLVVIPTRGYGALRRYLIGSVAAKILHDLSCPVLTGVHMEDQEPLANVKLSNIVCALNLGAQSPDTLACASRLARDTRHQPGRVCDLQLQVETGMGRDGAERCRKTSKGSGCRKCQYLYSARRCGGPSVLFCTRYRRRPGCRRAWSSGSRNWAIENKRLCDHPAGSLSGLERMRPI